MRSWLNVNFINFNLVIKNFEERKIIMAEGNNHKYIHDPTID